MGVSSVHFHRAQVRGGVAGLQNGRAQVQVDHGVTAEVFEILGHALDEVNGLLPVRRQC